MSFGKRSSATPPRVASPAAPMQEPPSPLWRQLRTLAVGVAVGLPLILGSQLLFMPLLGRSIDKRFEEHPAETALARASRTTNSSLIVACPAPSFGLEMPGRGEADSELPGFARDIVAEGRKVLKMSRHVTCLMTNDRGRLCQPKARADINLLVRTYLTMRADSKRYAERVLRLAVANPNRHNVESGLKSRPGSVAERQQRVSQETKQAVESLLELDIGLIRALQGLVRDGFVSKADFSGFLGIFMPAELAPHFDGIEATGHPCS